MKFLLKLKAWQLFGLSWGLPMIMNLTLFSDPALMLYSFPIMMVLFLLGTFGWIWAIAVDLNKKLPEGVVINNRNFKFLFSFLIFYFVFIQLFMTISFFGDSPILPPEVMLIIFPLHFFAMAIIIWSIGFAAKTYKSVELQKNVSFSDYAGEFFLIWFSIIGYWVLQPKINKMISDS